MEPVTPGASPPADDEESRRRRLAEQVADRIQREMAGDLERLRARLRARLGLAPDPSHSDIP